MASILFDVYYSLYDNFMRTFKLDDHQAIVSIVEKFACKRRLIIADIGGGTGLLAHTLIGLGHEVIIIDPAEKMTGIAKQRNPEVKIVNEAFEKTNSGQSYDVIILKDCFHHIKDQTLALSKIFQVLQDDGLLIIQEFLPASISAKLIFAFERCCLEKVYPVDPAKLSEMMNHANMTSTLIHINSRDYLVTGVKRKI